MIIYGTGEKKLTSAGQPVKCKCPECGEFAITFHFFKKYFHLFWIPVFPFDTRKVAFCEKCNASYQESIPSSLQFEMENARRMTSTPVYLYIGLTLVVMGITSFIYFNDGTTTYYYPSKAKQANGKYVNDKMEGKWTYWFENGKIESEQYYKDGLEDSTWSWYDDEGRKIKDGDYLNGAFHGKWLFYYPSGALQEEDTYVENRKHGRATYYYENGQKYYEGDFIRDREDGKWTFWYEDGTILTEGQYATGYKTGMWKVFYPNGKLNSEILHKDSMSYIISDWDEAGNQLIKDGSGLSIDYYDNNQKSAEGKIKNGLNDGLWTYWYTNGAIKQEGIFTKGIYAMLNSWDIGGKQMVKGGNGYHKSYYDNGVVEFAVEYRNGKLHGPCVTRTADSLLVSELNYVDGKLNGEAKYYDEGNLWSEGNLKMDQQTGPWKWYYSNGKMEAQVTFVNGLKEGEEIFWSESGDVIKREFYEKGQLIREVMENSGTKE